MSRAPGFEYRVEPLSAANDRSAFHSGVPELDHYLHHQASQDARRKAATPFVLVGENGAIVGYYTLSAYSVRLGELPETIARKLPRYPLLQAILLGRFAIGASHRGQNLGRFLLMEALYRSWRNTAEIASVGVAVEALDETARAFYLHHDFTPLRDHANKLFIPMATIEKSLNAR